MAENAQVKKKPIQVLRERMGGLSDRMKAYLKDHRFIKNKLSASLKQGPKTVPEIARETELDTVDVMWHLMALKRYGLIVEGEKKGDYLEYKLKEGE